MTEARRRRMLARAAELEAEPLTVEEVRRETLVALEEGDLESIPGWLDLLIAVARREGIERTVVAARVVLGVLGGRHGETETHQG